MQYIKLKKNGNFKMGNLTLTEILSAWRDLFWIFVVPYKISHLFDNKYIIWLKIYQWFWSRITTCNLPTWPRTPCILISLSSCFCWIEGNLSKLFRFISLCCFQCGVQNFRRRDQCFKCGSPKSDIDASGEGADEVSPHPTSSKYLIFMKCV